MKELGGRRVLVTGGAGFIGSHLVDRLLTAGAHVSVLDDLSTGTAENLERARLSELFTFLQGSIRDPELVDRCLEGVDYVFHLAVSNLRISLKDPWLSHDVNAGGTLSLLERAAQRDLRRFVYCSSSEVYGSAAEPPMSEAHPTNPTTVYGASKLAGEHYSFAFLRTHDLPVVVVRPFNTYGPREHLIGPSGEVIPRMVLRALAGQGPVVFGDGRQSRDFTFVEETVQGILEVARADEMEGEVVNIARGVEVTIGDLAEHIRRVCDSDAPVIYEEERPADVDRQWADVSKARLRIGYEASVGIEEGLSRYVEWFRSTDPDIPRLLEAATHRNW